MSTLELNLQDREHETLRGVIALRLADSVLRRETRDRYGAAGRQVGGYADSSRRCPRQLARELSFEAWVSATRRVTLG